MLSHEHNCKKDQTKGHSLIYVSYTTTNWFINLQIGSIMFPSPTFFCGIMWAMKKKRLLKEPKICVIIRTYLSVVSKGIRQMHPGSFMLGTLIGSSKRVRSDENFHHSSLSATCTNVEKFWRLLQNFSAPSDELLRQAAL